MDILCIGINLPCAWSMPGHRILAPRLRYAYETAAKRNYVFDPGGLFSFIYELALLSMLPSLSRPSPLRYYETPQAQLTRLSLITMTLIVVGLTKSCSALRPSKGLSK